MVDNTKKDYLSKEEFIQKVRNKVDKLEVLKEGVYGYKGKKYFSVNFSKFPKVTYSDFDWIHEIVKTKKQIKVKEKIQRKKVIQTKEIDYGFFK